ncbi:MAG: diaminopimelate epimerase, partial [Acidimicrobiia bacterium]|nr:diaminopimelate epimerase [Acidimicrobiia bacterium]
FVAHDQGKTGNRVNVRLPGGDLLIGLEDDSVWMEGPAHEVFAGSVEV